MAREAIRIAVAGRMPFAYGLAVAVMLGASGSAHADVLQIGNAGDYQWVTGGPAAFASTELDAASGTAAAHVPADDAALAADRDASPGEALDGPLDAPLDAGAAVGFIGSAPPVAGEASLITGEEPLTYGGEVAPGSVTHALDAAGPTRWRERVARLAAKYDISPQLLEAVVWQESRWNELALSPVGARGLAQLMPGTAAQMGINASDPMANLEGGARYLRMQLDAFDGDIEKALAAYNAGPGRVLRAGGIPNIRETKAYVASIMSRLSNPVRQ